MPPQGSVDPHDDVVIVECKGGFAVTVHRKLLCTISPYFEQVLLRCKRQVAFGVLTLRTDMPRRIIQRYALWLYGTASFAKYDPSLTAPQLFLELSEVHMAAELPQDEGFGNDLMDAMISVLTARYDEMLLEDFLAEFVKTNPKGSMGRRLIADWIVWSMAMSDITPKQLLRQVQDLEFCYAVTKAVLKKTSREWEGDSMPPYLVSPCFYHVHKQVGKAGCSMAWTVGTRVTNARVEQ